MGFKTFHGNEKIAAALRGAMRASRLPHAILFTGPRGIGKYTLAVMLAAAANCEKLEDDFCGECATCQGILPLLHPRPLIEQGLGLRGESADAATVEREPLILQSHPDVWALVPDPVRLKTPVARPLLRIGQIRAAQRAAYYQPLCKRRVFIFDDADTMRWEVADVLLKTLEEPPGSSTFILTAPSPFSLLPTVLSRCMQFHFAPLDLAEVEAVIKNHSKLKASEMQLAAQLSAGSPGAALEMKVAEVVELRKTALRILERAARGQGFSQLFADTAALAKDKESTADELLDAFYGLLSDLLQISSGAKTVYLRNPHLRTELNAFARSISTDWVRKAIEVMDQFAAGMRRNLNRQLGLDAVAASLAPREPFSPISGRG